MSRFNHYEIPSDSRFSRREFIKLSGTASIAVLTVPMVSCNRDGQFGREHALFQNDTVPVLDQCDSIVVGGSFAGVSAALNFAKNGKKVVLVEQRIYLGREITSTYRPWIDLDEGSTGSDLPDLLLSCIEENIEQPFQNKKLLRFNHIKLTLEKALLSSKVNIVYASAPVQLVMDEGRLAGLVIGNKSGRQVILSKMILDCTETASVIHLTNHGFQESQSENTIFTKILEFNRIEPIDVESIDVPESLGINNNRVGVQRGYLSDNHYYIQCPIEYSNPEFDPESTVRREIDAWEKSIGVARYMYQEVPEFKDAFLTNSSYQLLGIYSTPMKPLSHEKLEEYPKADITFGRTTTANTAFATGIKNLWCISDAARLNPEQVRYLMTPQGACQAGNAVSANLLDFWKDLSDSSHLKTDIAEGLGEPNTDVVIKEKYSPHRGRDYHRIKIKNQPIPVLAEVDLLVVGGGSSGATAAYAAAQTGKKTMVVDLNPGFGGTGTYAGVQDYWGNGNYNGFTASHVKKMDEIHKFIPNHVQTYNSYFSTFITWNLQAKMYMWLKEIKGSGAGILWNAIVIGSLMDQNKVIGVVVATPRGVYSIKSKVLIDATGDGDVAAFAGAPFVYGSSRDHVPMWYALCRQFHPGITITGFYSTVDLSNIHDYTRSVHEGLRIGEDAHDHSTYLSPRESRHIQGEVVLTLSDHLTFRQWEDVINVHCSNCDMKGYHASDWQRIGLIPPNVNVEVPYRSIVPKEIENILVVGKALSAKHESLATIRMQHDLENLGGIAALAASDALDDGVFPRNLDVKKLQEKLIDLDLIPSNVLERQIKPVEYSEREIEELIDQFDPEMPLHAYSYMEMTERWEERIPFVEVCTSPKDKTIPVLKIKLTESSGKRALRIAQALAMMGSASGAEAIFKEIKNQLSISGSLPLLKDEIMHSGGPFRPPPDQGAMPLCANLIYALGMTRSELNIKAWELVSERFEAGKLDDFRSRDRSLFNYVDAVCYGAGLMGHPDAIPSLIKIYSNRFLNGQSIKSGIQEDFILERLGLLELILGRALARCGSIKGLQIMIEYLDDFRAILTEFAHTSLIRITHEDFGKNKQNWNDWVRSHAHNFNPVPLTEREDG